MASPSSPVADVRSRPRRILRVGWALASVFAIECAVFGLAVLPAALFWQLFEQRFEHHIVELVVRSMTFVPTYIIFAFCLMTLSALSTRLTGWRTPPNAQLRLSDLDWPLLDWARYMISVHLVRTFAGVVFRATPLWTFYLRLNGARLGRAVYVNSLAVNDHNLLEFGDHVVIGDGAHISGHTVERGLVKTAVVRLGPRTTVGLGSVVGIGVETGPNCQIGALSLVPKFTTLEGDAIWVGTPVRKLAGRAEAAAGEGVAGAGGAGIP